MLRPSYSELMNVLNTESELNSNITSRYIVVIAAAKRARQIVAGSAPQAGPVGGKPVSIAVNEMYENKLTVVRSTNISDEAKISSDAIFDGASFDE